MRRTKTRGARRVHPPVNAALEAINASAQAAQPIPVTNTRSVQRTLRSRSRELPPLKTNQSTQEPEDSDHINTYSHSNRPSSIRDRSTIIDHTTACHSFVSSRKSKPSKQFSRKSPSQRLTNDSPFRHSQRDVWERLPITHRMFSLLLGFLSMYYFVFAKHHHYDKEIIAIHADVENLLRQVNDSILGENLVEAVLPDIFKETRNQAPTPTPISGRGKNGNETASSHYVDVKAIKNNSLPLKLKKKKKALRILEQLGQSRTKTVDANRLHAGRNLSDLIVPHNGAEHVDREIEDISPNAAKSNSPSNANPERGKQQTPGSSSLQPKLTVQQRFKGNSLEKPIAGLGDAKGKKTVAQTASSETAGIDTNSSTQHVISRAKPEEHYDYSIDFKDLGGADVPKDHVPILNWNYEAVIDPETTEQIFASGDKLHHVAAYKPLCIEVATGEAISFSGKRVCSGFNRTAGWMIQYCDVLKESLSRENLLKIKAGDTPRKWLDKNRSLIRWVEGLTVLQVMEKNCGNIAHFAGRILMLQHIVDNIAAYASPPSTVENILILPTWDIMKRFLYPHNYDFWHKSVLSALVAPAKFTIGTLGNFLYREHKIPYSGLPRVQLLHNFSLTGGPEQEKKYVCFRQVLVPGYLKGRFFADDKEYPSKKPSLQSSVIGAPRIPRDSLRFREKVSALFNQTPHFSGMQKEIVFLDRNGSRRVLSDNAKADVVALFQRVSSESGYRFNIVSFDRMPFKEQYKTMKAASIAIGIHGANLVNAMFMPPLSVLFELFPFGFVHDMYANGGNSGLKYYKYQMRTGLPFEGPKRFRSVEQCIKLSHECKVHFRDSALQVTSDDLKAMERTLRDAIKWCEEQPKPFSSPEEARRAESLERRRRRLLDIRSKRPVS